MSFTPGRIWMPDPIYLTTYSANSLGLAYRGVEAVATGTGAFPSANRAYFHPFYLSAPYTIQRWCWLNGTTASTNNIQVGVYDEDFALIASSTSTTSSGASVAQYVTPGSPIILPRMRGYLAFWCNGTTAHQYRSVTANMLSINAYLQSSLASGLPSTATPASTVGADWTGVYGFTSCASP